jgi:hypothetical protein
MTTDSDSMKRKAHPMTHQMKHGSAGGGGLEGHKAEDQLESGGKFRDESKSAAKDELFPSQQQQKGEERRDFDEEDDLEGDV